MSIFDGLGFEDLNKEHLTIILPHLLLRTEFT